MKLFINDIPVQITRMDEELKMEKYDIIVDGKKEDVDKISYIDDVLITDASSDQIIKVFSILKNKKMKDLDSITFAVNDQESVVHFVKSKFQIIKAAGGLITKDDKILLIYRLKKWDLPKGKQDKNESLKEAAIREVEEECNIKVKLEEKICSTWHTYTSNGKRIMKKTTWYHMSCLDDSKMKPQIDEDIEEIRWMEAKDIRQAMYNTYPSIRNVIHDYYKMVRDQEV